MVAARYARSFLPAGCDRLRSSVRPLGAASHEAAGRYDDLWVGSYSI